jgi:SAM-dependent methyltransferase
VLCSTRYTLEFVRSHLSKGARDILEIGSGRGELAAALQACGYKVLAIDNESDAVAKAKSRGVAAVQMNWPATLEQQFDAVLFTQSLHHIEPLDEALSAAVKVLRSGGRIIVEDHRTEGATARSSAWYSNLVRLFDASGAFGADADVAALLSKVAPDDHGHRLHSSSSIATALERLGHVERSDAAYYYRYLEAHFREPAAAERMLEHEISLIESGAIGALGVRFTLSIL